MREIEIKITLGDTQDHPTHRGLMRPILGDDYHKVKKHLVSRLRDECIFYGYRNVKIEIVS